MHEKGIETFLAVAMSRTLGKAAELLNVTQSTISSASWRARWA